MALKLLQGRSWCPSMRPCTCGRGSNAVAYFIRFRYVNKPGSRNDRSVRIESLANKNHRGIQKKTIDGFVSQQHKFVSLYRCRCNNSRQFSTISISMSLFFRVHTYVYTYKRRRAH